MWYINRVGLTKVCYVWKNYLCVIALYEGFVPPFHCVLGSSIWSCCTAPWGRCAHINKSWPCSSHLTQSFLLPPQSQTHTNRNHALSLYETLPSPSIITGYSAWRKLSAFLFASDTSSTVPVRVVLGGVLPFTDSFTAARETHSRATANFILPLDCTDSATDQTIVNSLSHTHKHTQAGTRSPAGCITSATKQDLRMGADARRSGGSLAALRNTAGDTGAWCVFTHTCAVIALALALLFGMALHVFVCVRVCLRRCGISGASPKWGRDGAGGCGAGRTNDNSNQIKLKLTSLKWLTDFSNKSKINIIFFYKLTSQIPDRLHCGVGKTVISSGLGFFLTIL